MQPPAPNNRQVAVGSTLGVIGVLGAVLTGRITWAMVAGLVIVIACGLLLLPQSGHHGRAGRGAPR